ncbi:drug/metabolite transporter (DMT)-like permease [Thermolongibacillus altinsuensis]|jgi:drug/metabolite transporter (DMT)-like permease|uniref:Drug/metabolite transporter (DMT)-like permease n=1 Tax=Thermolongibacillus altinsuensis TaxID=575256 RepID=A0A4R1Q8W7_9BACL|nr:DMT family transporter [Thermolongibacillus altinsuensis]TCL44899.1 drug/metabolite transporter (DMT)-like permease [Thermolongibacillus altinsuensis]GMB08156.1 putative transporter YyaM [Thermolongibacillus altinsuensis]
MRERIFLILANLFWAGNYVFGKYVVAEMSPLWITFTRWFLALTFLIPISYFVERPNYREVFKHFWLPLSCMGILGVIGYNLLLYGALEYTSPMNASLVNALNPAMMVVFSFLILKERMTWVNVGGFALSLIGVLLILTKGHLEWIFQTTYNRGDLMMIAANLVWVFYSIIGKRLAVPPITATACSVFLSVIFLFPFLFLQPFDITQLSARGMTGIIYMWLFPSVCSFVFWNMAVKKVGPSHAGVYLNLITVFTAIITLMLGEKILESQIIGGAFVLIGVYFATKMTKPKEKVIRNAQV